MGLYSEEEETRTSIYRPEPRRRPLQWWLVASVAGLVAGTTVLVARHGGSSEPPRSLTLSGALIATELTAVTPEVDGRVAEVHVAAGSLVIAGEELLRLDPRPFEAELAKSRLSLRVARAETTQAEARAGFSLRAFRRTYVKVHHEDVDPESDADVRLARATLELDNVRLEAARSREADATAALKGVQQAREALVVRAPFDGVVREVAAAGSHTSGAVARIDRRPEHKELVSCVAPRPPLEIGQSVRLVLAGQTVRARVSSIDPGCSEGGVRLRLVVDKAPRTLQPSATVSAQLYFEG